MSNEDLMGLCQERHGSFSLSRGCTAYTMDKEIKVTQIYLEKCPLKWSVSK